MKELTTSDLDAAFCLMYNHASCSWSWRKGCSDKVSIYYILISDIGFVERICTNHLIDEVRSNFYQILTEKELFYLKITGKL